MNGASVFRNPQERDQAAGPLQSGRFRCVAADEKKNKCSRHCGAEKTVVAVVEEDQKIAFCASPLPSR
jgi:hypothetical protein